MEMGEAEKALAVAGRFERQRAAWVDDAPDDHVRVLAYLVRAHRAPASQLEAARAAALGPLTVGGIASPAGARWENLYALPASTPAEARDALAALPSFGAPAGRTGDRQLAKGRTYLLAGRVPEALPYLRRAAHACAWLGQARSGWSFGPTYDDSVHAKGLLGEALEATGDQAGACAAYADVIARWGNAKPRSVTADKARARASALGCKN